MFTFSQIVSSSPSIHKQFKKRIRILIVIQVKILTRITMMNIMTTIIIIDDHDDDNHNDDDDGNHKEQYSR